MRVKLRLSATYTAYVAGVICWCSIAAAQSFTIGVNVKGTSLSNLSALNNGVSFIPPDTMGAIGPSSFVELTNGSFAVYNKTDGSLIGSRTGLSTFWTNAGITGLDPGGSSGAGTTDPHVVYDAASSRWFAVTVDIPPTPSGGTAPTNRMLVAVSKTSDPTQGWNGFSFTSSATTNLFADFPQLGINNDAVYVATNNFSNVTNGFTGVSLVVLPKTGLTTGTGTISGRTIFDNIASNAANYPGFTPHPITDFNNGTGSEPLLSAFNSTHLKASTITGTNTASPSLNTTGGLMTVSTMTTPLSAHQSGGINTIDAGDTRLSGNVIQQGSNIWAVQTVKDPTTTLDDLRWYRIDAATQTVQETGTIADSTHDYYYGSIAVNSTGQIVIGYTRSGSTEFASAYASIGQLNGSTTSFQSPTTLKEGAASYNVTFGGPSNRWGDYSQTTIDPSNPLKFWTIQEYASASNIWSTDIAEIDFASAPEPSSLMLLTVGACGLLIRRRRVCHPLPFRRL